ncbi:hypothetical protein HYV50_01575 [Candidatus Pacearchaeota archaeon]|nr:hypothetical protein [Candidatus Pacearchaeota archaeon]
MTLLDNLKKFWKFLQEDSWQSWIVSILLLVVVIKYVFFPFLSLATGSSLPLVVVESCSMYHETNFDGWWEKNSLWYESNNIGKESFMSFPLKNGFIKGDIIFVWGHSDYEKGDIIIFEPNEESIARHPIIHRVVSENPIATRGDHNNLQLRLDNNAKRIDETNIPEEKIIGKAVFKIPFLGWIKLVFFEPLRPTEERGFCN